MNLTLPTLEGKAFRLEPLDASHAGDLLQAASDDQIWTYLDEETPRTRPQIDRFIQDAIEEHSRGARLPFAIVDRETEKAIGSISLIDIQHVHRGVEVGWAWLSPGYWRSGASREAVYLLLKHAFEEMGAIRAAFKTDSRNIRSQNSILGMGATREGVFRNHRILSDGYVRDSIYYSILDREWLHIRQTMEADQAAYRDNSRMP